MESNKLDMSHDKSVLIYLIQTQYFQEEYNPVNEDG